MSITSYPGPHPGRLQALWTHHTHTFVHRSLYCNGGMASFSPPNPGGAVDASVGIVACQETVFPRSCRKFVELPHRFTSSIEVGQTGRDGEDNARGASKGDCRSSGGYGYSGMDIGGSECNRYCGLSCCEFLEYSDGGRVGRLSLGADGGGGSEGRRAEQEEMIQPLKKSKITISLP